MCPILEQMLLISYEASSPTNFDITYLVLAGGAGSSSGIRGGAGGAGGYRTNKVGDTSGRGASAEATKTIAKNTNYTVTVGQGGAPGANGSNSVFDNITSLGGGKPGENNGSGSNGGSGGGSGNNVNSPGSGTSAQGYDGASNGGKPGGGGGAGGAPSGAIGGVGIASSITGSSVTRGKGGNAQISGSTAAAAGTANKGEGADGRWDGSSASGGSGVVILVYSDVYTITIGAGLTGTESNLGGGFKCAIITAGTGTVSWN